MESLKEFQKKTGYTFRQEGLLRQALTHSSYANEKHLKKLSDNERLEFLGDAVLEIITSEYLYHAHRDLPEGELTKMRASIVCEQTLAFCTRKLDLGKYLFLGKGENQTGGRQRKSILSDAFEAVIGAIYLDGGFANAKVQAEYNGELEYCMVAQEGPDHDKRFIMEAKIGDKTLGRGEGHTKKAAEQEAAYQAILKLKHKDGGK